MKYKIKYKTVVIGASSGSTWNGTSTRFDADEDEIEGTDLKEESFLDRDWLTLKVEVVGEVKVGTKKVERKWGGKIKEYDEDVVEERVVETKKHFIPIENVFEIIEINQINKAE